MITNLVSDRELRQRRLLKRLEQLIPQMIEKLDKKGGIVVAKLGRKHLFGDRVMELTLEARLVSHNAGGAHNLS
jgi:hypothetical protein